MGMFSQLAQGWTGPAWARWRCGSWRCCCAWWSMRSAMAWRPTGWGPHREAESPAVLNPIHHLDPFGLLMMVVVGLAGPSPCRWTPLLPQAQAGYGHHRAGRTGFQLPVGLCVGDPLQWIVRGAGGAGGRPRGWPWHWSFRRTGDPEHRPGYFQLDSLPAPGRFQGCGHVPVGPAIRAVDASGAVWDDCADGRPSGSGCWTAFWGRPILDAGLDAPGASFAYTGVLSLLM